MVGVGRGKRVVSTNISTHTPSSTLSVVLTPQHPPRPSDPFSQLGEITTLERFRGDSGPSVPALQPTARAHLDSVLGRTASSTAVNAVRGVR